jgi:hypothetical protein
MNKYTMTPYNTFIAKSSVFSRYLDDKGRREHWNETVASDTLTLWKTI